MGRLADVARAVTRGMSPVVKSALWTWSRFYVWLPGKKGHPKHWLVEDLLNTVNYRIPVRTKLGNGMKIIVPWNDDGGESIYQTGYYEPKTVALIARLATPGMTFFDIGANVGQYTLVIGKILAQGGGQVHSFEPDPTTFEWLARNTRINGMKNVQLNRTALLDKSGDRKFYLATPRDTGSNSFAMPWTFSGRTCVVNCTTLDEYLTANNVNKVDLMKIDVEGSESFVLRGGESLLQRYKPVLIVEFEEEMQQKNGASCVGLASFLKLRGYHLLRSDTLQDYEAETDQTRSLNVVAIPEERVQEVMQKLRGFSMAA